MQMSVTVCGQSTRDVIRLGQRDVVSLKMLLQTG